MLDCRAFGNRLNLIYELSLFTVSGASVDAKLDILLQNQQTMMSMLHRLVSSGNGGGATVDVKEHMEEQFKEKCTTYEALMEFDQKVQNDQQYRLQLVNKMLVIDLSTSLVHNRQSILL